MEENICLDCVYCEIRDSEFLCFHGHTDDFCEGKDFELRLDLKDKDIDLKAYKATGKTSSEVAEYAKEICLSCPVRKECEEKEAMERR